MHLELVYKIASVSPSVAIFADRKTFPKPLNKSTLETVSSDLFADLQRAAGPSHLDRRRRALSWRPLQHPPTDS